MTRPEDVRCKKCSYLEDGVCTDCGLNIYEIEDEDCPLEEEA